MEESEALVVHSVEISCREVWRELSNFVDDLVEAELRLRMEEHFKDCEHCSAILDGTRNVIQLVGDGKVFAVPEGFSQRLKKRLSENR
jgi:Putative zinc-finger